MSQDSKENLKVAAIVVVAIILLVVLPALLKAMPRTPNGGLAIAMTGLGDREVAAGSTDVKLVKIKLTADMAGDVSVSQIVMSSINIVGRGTDGSAIRCVELWADMVGKVNTFGINTFGTLLAHKEKTDDVSITGEGLYLLPLDEAIVIPAGTTMDLLLVGDIALDTSVGAKYAMKPGSDTRDGAVATDTKGRPVTVVWTRDCDWSQKGHWPEGHIITITAPKSGR
jgi:hypothetical protein